MIASFDDIDAKVDTPGMKNPFYGTACTIYQKVPDMGERAYTCEIEYFTYDYQRFGIL